MPSTPKLDAPDPKLPKEPLRSAALPGLARTRISIVRVRKAICRTDKVNEPSSRMTAPDRPALRAQLDMSPDFTASGGRLEFNQRFATTTSAETFCAAPQRIVDAGRSLLSAPLDDSVANVVHNTIAFDIGCNRIPLHALASGGRGGKLSWCLSMRVLRQIVSLASRDSPGDFPASLS